MWQESFVEQCQPSEKNVYRVLCAHSSSQPQRLLNITLDAAFQKTPLWGPSLASLEVLGLLFFRPPLVTFYLFLIPFLALPNLLPVVQPQKDPANLTNVDVCMHTHPLTHICTHTCTPHPVDCSPLKELTFGLWPAPASRFQWTLHVLLSFLSMTQADNVILWF